MMKGGFPDGGLPAKQSRYENTLAGGGGGLTGVFLDSKSFENALIIAGSGGGGGNHRSHNGGAGGGAEGQNGSGSHSGTGGNQKSRGRPGKNRYGAVTPGQPDLFSGGQGGVGSYDGGAGGGSGYCGGGGGGEGGGIDSGAGGGGSGYLSPLLEEGRKHSGHFSKASPEALHAGYNNCSNSDGRVELIWGTDKISLESPGEYLVMFKGNMPTIQQITFPH